MTLPATELPHRPSAPNPAPRLRATLALAALGCALWALPVAPARADADYETLIAEGVAEFEAKNWEESRALFKRAYELLPNARALRGAALAAYQARAYVAAYHDLLAALEEKSKPLTKKQRAEVERLLVTTRTFISRVPIQVEPPGAEVSVDGGPAVIKDGELWLDPGVHDIRVHAAGREPSSQRIKADPAESLELRIVLNALEPEPAPDAEPAQAPELATSATEPAEPGRRFGPWPWVSAGLAAAFVGAAVGLHVASGAGADQVEQDCPQDRCTLAEVNAAIDDAHIELFDALAVTSWILAGVSAATSVTLFVLGGSAERSPDAEGPALGLRLGPAGVALDGRF